jgi:hypothetical protein
MRPPIVIITNDILRRRRQRHRWYREVQACPANSVSIVALCAFGLLNPRPLVQVQPWRSA